MFREYVKDNLEEIKMMKGIYDPIPGLNVAGWDMVEYQATPPRFQGNENHGILARAIAYYALEQKGTPGYRTFSERNSHIVGIGSFDYVALFQDGTELIFDTEGGVGQEDSRLSIISRTEGNSTALGFITRDEGIDGKINRFELISPSMRPGENPFVKWTYSKHIMHITRESGEEAYNEIQKMYESILVDTFLMLFKREFGNGEPLDGKVINLAERRS